MRLIISSVLLVLSLNVKVYAQTLPITLPIEKSRANTVYINAVLDDRVEAKFMIDTGSSVVVLNTETFDRLKINDHSITETSPMGARLASGRIKLVKRYRIASLSLSKQCHFDDVEIAVMEHSNNILGMNLLNLASPFAFYPTAGELRLSRCERHE